MRGTEKQVKWANEIIERITVIMEQGAENIAKMDGDEAIKAKNVADLRVRAEALRNAAYAGDVIELFRGIQPTGVWHKDLDKVLSVYRMGHRYGLSQSQRELLCYEEVR